MKKVICLIFICLSSFSLWAQTNVDSLVNVLNTQTLSVDEEMQLYWDIMMSYWNRDVEKTIAFGKEGLELSEKAHKNLWCARFSRVIGFSYIHKNRSDSSLYHLENAIEFAVKANNKREEIFATVFIGSVYLSEAKYELALDLYLDVLPQLSEAGEHEQYANCLINVAIIYRQLRHMDKALEYGKQAMGTAEKYDLSYPEMCSLELLGSVYYEKEEYDHATSYLLKAYEISCQQNDNVRIITLTQMLANLYCRLDKYDEAEKYAIECLELVNKFGNEQHEIMAYSVMWNVRYNQKRYEESIVYATKMWEVDTTHLDWAVNAALKLCYSNIALGKEEDAADFLDKYVDIKDKLTSRELNASLADMEVKYETEKKEMRIVTLEEDRKLYISLSIAVLVAFLFGMGLLIYRHRLTAQKKKIAEQQVIQLEQEKKLIAVQSSLKAEKTERDLIAHDLHDSVSSLLTVVKNNMSLYSASDHQKTDYFNNAFEVLSKSIIELRRVVYHLKSFILTKEGLAAALDDFCRFIPDVEFHFNGLNRRFDPDKEYVLYDCACELINNALKHSGASRIDVHLNIDEQVVYLSVADNGKGFDAQGISPGIGLDNIHSNLSAFGGHLEILSEPDKGTEANIEMDI